MQDLLRHEAQPYAGRVEFVPSCVSLVRDGLERGERLMLLAAGEKLDAVRDALADQPADVTFVATDEHGRNPSRITSLLHSFQAAGDGRHSLGVSETVHRGRSAAAHVEAQLSDSVLNHRSVRSWPLTVVCLHDTTELDEPGLQTMFHNHAVVRGSETNPDYLPDQATAMFSTPLGPPPAGATRLTVTSQELAQMRAFVRAAAAGFGIAADRADDLVLAANEIVTNSLRHGGGIARLAMWFEDGAAVCEVRDRGHIRDPLVGRFAPPPAATSGRGIWLANHLCDLVQLRSFPMGTVARMYVET